MSRPLIMKIKPRKKAAWDACSKFVRLSHAEPNGNVRCYTCGTPMNWKESEAGHGIGGRGNFILFELKVIRPQCTHCNKYLSGNYEVFVPKLMEEIGKEVYDDLLFQSRKPLIMKPYEFLEIEEMFKEKLLQV